MPVAIPSTSEIVEKWKRRVATAAADYEKGVKNPKRDWKANSLAAAGSFNTAMQQVISNNSFSKGVDASTTQDWKNAASTKGKDRWPAGVAAAGPAYAEGFDPYRNAIANADLPARGPKRSQANKDRMNANVDAIIAEYNRQRGLAG